MTGGKDIKTRSSIVKDETLDIEGDKDNYFHNVYGSLIYHKNPIWSVRRNNLDGYIVGYIYTSDIIVVVN